MALRLDVDALASAGTSLAASAQPVAPGVATPPGADLTSLSAAAQLNAHCSALAALIAHGAALREVGGLTVQGSAAHLVAADEANAALIAGTGTGAEPAVGLISPPAIPTPQLPCIPPFPSAIDPLPGEAHAEALYSGPGPSSLHAFADHWDNTAQQLDSLAAKITQTGASIDSAYVDGVQQAGANTVDHAAWVSQMSVQARKLAQYARAAAESYSTAKANTPSPQEFEKTRTQLNDAIQRFAATRGKNASEVAMHTQQYAQQQSQATTAAFNHHAATSAAASTAATDLKTAPAINKGGAAQALGSDVPLSPPPTDPPHGKDPRYWIDVNKIIHVPDGQMAPNNYRQIGPNLWYPSPDRFGVATNPPAPVQYPLDIGDIKTVSPQELLPPGYRQVAPGIGILDTGGGTYQPVPPWTPKAPIDIRDIIQVSKGQLAPWGYSEFFPGWYAPTSK